MVTREEATEAMAVVVKFLNGGELDQHTDKTAERYIKAWVEDWGEGYSYDMNFTTFEDKSNQMIVELDIPVVSHCAHHLAPISGVAHIAYIPKDKIVGLSKLNRIVEKFSRRLQVQERLTEQIANELMCLLGCEGVGVQIVAEHFCVSTRGVRHHGARTVTTSLRGCFLDDGSVKQEFLNTILTHSKEK